MTEDTSHTLLLDLDGTLIDPLLGIRRCIVHALQAQQLPPPLANAIKGWIGPPLQESFTAYFAQLGQGDAQRAVADYRARYAETGLYEHVVYPGIPEALQALVDKDRRLILATAKPRRFAQQIVVHFGLDQYLDAVHGSALDGRYSDKADLLQLIFDQHDLKPEACTMVGDRKYDILAARQHGSLAVAVLWGYGSVIELKAAGAAQLLKAPAELALL